MKSISNLEATLYTEINYLVHEVCVICQHGNFKPGTIWGSCDLASKEARICVAGKCDDWMLNEEITLGQFSSHMANNTQADRAVESIKKGLPTR